MKKLVIAGVCGVCIMAACVFATSSDANNSKVAGSGASINIKI